MAQKQIQDERIKKIYKLEDKQKLSNLPYKKEKE